MANAKLLLSIIILVFFFKRIRECFFSVGLDGFYCRSDILYAANNGKNVEYPPIIVGIQQVVNQKFIYHLINYVSHVYDRYNVRPIILVIVANSFVSLNFQEHFTTSSKNSMSFRSNLQTMGKRMPLFLTLELVSITVFFTVSNMQVWVRDHTAFLCLVILQVVLLGISTGRFTTNCKVPNSRVSLLAFHVDITRRVW
ncbi:hypothetical protein BD770DRAFT_407631 [Pilaira anomala]|nr:hypothetical protein BD770DRAFT_407631 [Pilaira anomala]